MIGSVPTILYVDDNLKSRRLLGSVLGDCGFEVITTANPVDAIREFRKLPFDAALIDYRMPIMSGPDLAVEMKTLRPNVPVVMLSGCAILPDRELLYGHLLVRELSIGLKPPRPAGPSRPDGHADEKSARDGVHDV